jgi:hypothetical protein
MIGVLQREPGIQPMAMKELVKVQCEAPSA